MTTQQTFYRLIARASGVNANWYFEPGQAYLIVPGVGEIVMHVPEDLTAEDEDVPCELADTYTAECEGLSRNYAMALHINGQWQEIGTRDQLARALWFDRAATEFVGAFGHYGLPI